METFMDRKFTSSPWGFRYYSFEKYCKFMKSIGITEVCSMMGDPKQFPLSIAMDINSACKAREIAENMGMSILEVSASRDHDKNIPLAKELGVKYYRICDIIEDTPENRKVFPLELRKAGEVAAEYGIEVVLENHGGLLTKASICREILEEAGRENVKLNYDPANFMYYGEDPLKALDEVLELVGFTHFKSIKYNEENKAVNCRLDEGLIDYKVILKRLLPKYNGYLGLEYEDPDDAEKGTTDDFEHIKNLL
jgi:sugar phosphate isomerase/epimerase